MSDDPSDPPKRRSLNVVTPNAMVERLRAQPTPASPPPSPPIASTDPTASDASNPHGLSGERLVIRDSAIAALETVFDPEIPLNVYDLGLVYDIDVDEQHHVTIAMTLTAPACPMADSIVRDVQTKVAAQPGIAGVKVNLAWSPPWDKSRMSEAAMLELGLL